MGQIFDRLEVYLGLLVLALVVTREFLTLRENTILLEGSTTARRSCATRPSTTR